MHHVTLVLLVMGVPDIAGRLSMGWLADRGWIPRVHLLGTAAALQVVVWVAISFWSTFATIVAFALATGALGGAVITLMAPVMVDAVGIRNINAALGFIMFTKLLFFEVPLLLGKISDVYVQFFN